MLHGACNRRKKWHWLNRPKGPHKVPPHPGGGGGGWTPTHPEILLHPPTPPPPPGWGRTDTKQNPDVGSNGQNLTTNVSMAPCNKFVTNTMSYVAALHLYPNQIRYQNGPYAHCRLDKGQTFTRGVRPN